MELRTKTQLVIKCAFDRGYRVTNGGRLLSINGIEKPIKLYGKQRYPSFSIHYNGNVYGIPTHHMAAFCFYKEDSFKDGIVIRHLNGNTLDVSRANIVLGSHSQNNLDKPKEARINAAKKARAAQGKSSFSAKLSNNDVLEIRKSHNELNGCKRPYGFVTDLTIKYKVSRTVIYNVIKFKYYKQ